MDWDDEEVLNRARLYRDRRDFVIQNGDSGMPEQYPSDPGSLPLRNRERLPAPISLDLIACEPGLVTFDCRDAD